MRFLLCLTIAALTASPDASTDAPTDA